MLIRWPDDPTVWPAGLPPPSVPSRAAPQWTLSSSSETWRRLCCMRRERCRQTHHARWTEPRCSASSGLEATQCGRRCPAAQRRAARHFLSSTIFAANASNHWSAITDGASKYVFEAQHGQEQLFDLNEDPRETRDVSGDPAYSSTLSKLRADLVAQYRREERGPNWVMKNKSVPRPKSQLYSPNYPGVVRRRMSRTFLTHDTAKR